MNLLLIRHAEPETGTADVDPPLSARGRSQAAALAEWLRGEPITALYSSPLRRAGQTAAFLEPVVGRAPVTVEDIAEFGVGREYVAPEALRRAGHWETLAAGDLSLFGTDGATFRTTVVPAVEAIVDAHPGETVAVVCHGGVINAWLGHHLGIEALLWCAMDYASVTRVKAARAGARSVVTLNERPHGCGGPSTYRP